MKKFHLSILLLAALLALSACNYPSGETTPTVAPMDAINTAAAQTVIAMSTSLAVTATPGEINPTQPQQNTAEPTNTALPVVTLAPVVTFTPSGGGGSTSNVCDRAKFVKDVSIPDDTPFTPGTAFTKTWRLQNVGTCSWNTGYKMVFDSGDAMNGAASVSLPGTVAPGQEIDVSVNLKAPSTNGKYMGYWKLENGSGQRFGLGDGNKAFWVKIVVGSTPEPFAVTSADLSVDGSTITAECPYTFDFNIRMRVTEKGTVTYHLERSDGETTSMREVEFSEAGVQNFSRSWKFDKGYDGWVKVYVDNPNHQYFPPLNIKLTCE